MPPCACCVFPTTTSCARPRYSRLVGRDAQLGHAERRHRPPERARSTAPGPSSAGRRAARGGHRRHRARPRRPPQSTSLRRAAVLARRERRPCPRRSGTRCRPPRDRRAAVVASGRQPERLHEVAPGARAHDAQDGLGIDRACPPRSWPFNDLVALPFRPRRPPTRTGNPRLERGAGQALGRRPAGGRRGLVDLVRQSPLPERERFELGELRARPSPGRSKRLGSPPR